MDTTPIMPKQKKLGGLIQQGQNLAKSIKEEEKDSTEINKQVDNWLLETKLTLEIIKSDAVTSFQKIYNDYKSEKITLDPEVVVSILKFSRDILIATDTQEALKDTDRRISDILSSQFLRTPIFYLQLTILATMAGLAVYGNFQLKDVKVDIRDEMKNELMQVKDTAILAKQEILEKAVTIEKDLNDAILSAIESKGRLEVVISETGGKITAIEDKLKSIDKLISNGIVVESKKHTEDVTAAATHWMKGELQGEVDTAKQELNTILEKKSANLTATNLILTGKLQSSVDALKSDTEKLNENLGQVKTTQESLSVDVKNLSKLTQEARTIIEDKDFEDKLDRVNVKSMINDNFLWLFAGAYGLGVLGLIIGVLTYFYVARSVRLR